MLAVGATAPRFELPAFVDESYRQVALEEFLGEDVVVLAFIPGDFNPACDEQSCDLEELDLFTMQKDVTVLGISPDSVYSHRAFADTYDLTIPLLADTDHEVARQYDVEFVDDLGQRLVERAVVVIDHDGVVQYTWSTTDPDRRPDVEPVKDAIGETGGDDTAFACYRVGHAHYTEGRRAFTAAMESFNESEWMLAQGDFQQAREEFEAAEDQFDTAARFVDDPTVATVYEGAQTKTNALWQAAAWLAKSANQYSSGNGVAGRTLREDAERRLEAARDYRDPPDPDQWPPDVVDLRRDGDRGAAGDLLPGAESETAALDVDIDAEVEPEADAASTAGEAEPDERERTAGAAEQQPAGDEDIDDEELAAIHAEVEASNPGDDTDPADGSSGDRTADESPDRAER
ncbi:redoxin domain-containing protein [Halomicroarcula sp. GCM10025324]|uniref:peroxiredoxin n=1 Tax=Haloarcula TaxID=2237 RepID=UPI0030103D18